MIINCFENQLISKDRMPSDWANSLYDFKSYLQNCWTQYSALYKDENYISSDQQFISFDHINGFKTRKYIGTIRYKNSQINIFPKVFEENGSNVVKDEDFDTMIQSLLIWISYCDRKIFPYVSDRSELSDVNSLKELFIILYSKYVLETLNKQLFFCYVDRTETGSYIKGKIDFKNYVTKKIPYGNMHLMNYSYSDFVFDNKINRIIKYVCKSLIYSTENIRSRIYLQNAIMRLSDISDESFTPSDCDGLHLENNSAYSTIISLSKMFLLNKINENKFGSTDTFCFLFPSDLLFEQFVAGFMKETFEKTLNIANVHPQPKDTYLADLVVNGDNRGRFANLIEDILLEKNGVFYVFDTKYKKIEKFINIVNKTHKLDVNIDDIRQMAIYALQRNAKRLCLIYPLYKGEHDNDIEIRLDIKPFEDKTKTFPCYIVKIPYIFDDDERIIKERIKNILYKIIV